MPSLTHLFGLSRATRPSLLVSCHGEALAGDNTPRRLLTFGIACPALLMLLTSLAGTGVGCGSTAQGSPDGGQDDAAGGSDTGSVDSAGDAASCPPEVDFDTDQHNCGACKHDCLGGECSAGVCQPIQVGSYAFNLGPAEPTDLAIAVDVTNVYLVHKSTSPTPIVRMSIASGATSVFATAQLLDSRPLVAGGNLLYSELGDGLTGLLMQRSLTAPTSPTTWSTSVQGDVVYAADDTGVFYADSSGNIMRAPFGGAAGPFLALWQMYGAGAAALSATADRLIVFAVAQPDGGQQEVQLYAMAKSGGAPSLLTSFPGYLGGLADDGGAYWIDSFQRSLMQASTTAPGTPQALVPAKQLAKAYALDARAFFWLAYDQDGSYELRSWDRTSQLAHDVPVVGDIAQIADIAIDRLAVYWVTYAGVVYRVARN